MTQGLMIFAQRTSSGGAERLYQKPSDRLRPVWVVRLRLAPMIELLE
jgi:hypothetical protein